MKTRHVSRSITVGAACLAIPFFFANLSSADPPDYLVADLIAEDPPKAWGYTEPDPEAHELLTFVEPYGDYNGDGFADFLVGTKAKDTDFIEGFVRLLSGKDGTVLFSFNASETDGQHAYAWPVAGDINGDGLPDLAIGVTYYDDDEARPLENRVGSALVFLTTDGHFGSGFAPRVKFNAADVEVEGQAHTSNEQSQFGYNIALVDFDGNGLKDLVLGEWRHRVGGGANNKWFGAFYVYSSCELTSGNNFLADDDHRIAIGEDCRNQFSLCMDALDDGQVVMGAARWWEQGPMNKRILGRVYVYEYSGDDCGTPAMFDKLDFTSVVVDNPEPDPLTTFSDCANFPASDQDFGHRTSSAGDFDNDGDIDLLVGARNRDKVWLMQYDSVTGAYTQYGEDYDDPSVPPTGGFGAKVGSIGDIDGDGYDDFAIGDTQYKDGVGDNVGRLYVYSGRTAFEDDTVQPLPIFTITGEQAGSIFGGGSGHVGDINHDGVPDLGISARRYDIGGVDEAGKVYGVFTPTEDEESVTVVRGTPQSGTIDDLLASDDSYYVVRSGIAKTVIDVVFNVPLAPFETIDFAGVTIESKAIAFTSSIITGEALIQTGIAFSSIGTWTVSADDTLVKFFEIAHTYINNGQITVRIVHEGIGLTFDSYYDKVTLVVSRTPP